ncbi:hypothetical protein [Streptomyces sp. NPDC002845]
MLIRGVVDGETVRGSGATVQEYLGHTEGGMAEVLLDRGTAVRLLLTAVCARPQEPVTGAGAVVLQ